MHTKKEQNKNLPILHNVNMHTKKEQNKNLPILHNVNMHTKKEQNKNMPILHNVNMHICPHLIINACNFVTRNWEKLNFYHSSWNGIQHNIVYVFKHGPSWIVTLMLVWIILNL